MLISTKHAPLTDGYRRNLRHEGHNLNATFGALTVFATFNFADNYAPLMFSLLLPIDDLKCINYVVVLTDSEFDSPLAAIPCSCFVFRRRSREAPLQGAPQRRGCVFAPQLGAQLRGVQ